MITQLDTGHNLAKLDMSHDAGLEHNHNWARERSGGRSDGQLIADASTARTPSCAIHDDAIYAAF